MLKACPVCQKQFETGSRKKQLSTCSRSCSNTFFKDRRHTLISRKKRSESLKGRLSCPRLRNQKKCCVCDVSFDCSPSANKKTCGQKSCVSINRSRVLKGKTGGPRVGGGWGRQTYYGGVLWDSTWEAKFAQRLDELDIKWSRPGKEQSIAYFSLSGVLRRYYPDIYLHDHDLFVEIKGFWTADARHKVQQARLKVKLLVLESLQEIEKFTGVSFSG